MSYPYHAQGGHYGIPQYPSEPPRSRQMPPSQGRPPPPQQAGYGPNAQRGPPPVRPMRPGHQQYAQPMAGPPPPAPEESTENLYDGSAYGDPEYVEQNDLRPLPAAPNRPYVEQGRSHSPQNRSPNGRRRPPQRPQRPDYEQPVLDPPRQARVAPANQQYRQPPPAPPPSHHGSGQWTGDGYSSPSSAYPPRLQQAVYQQGLYGQANKRPPLGPPPSARRGPASYYPQVAPVHPIAEEIDSMRGSIRQGSSIYPSHDSMKSYASSNAIPIGIPDYYLEQRHSMPSLPGAEQGPHEDDYDTNESPIDGDLPAGGNGRESRLAEREEGYSSREDASPEPAALIRQASFGRKTKPTLTTVKSGERMRKLSSGEGLGSLPSQQKAVPDMPAMDKETGFAKEAGGSIPSDSENGSYEEPRDTQRFGNGDKELEAGGAAAVASLAVAAPVYVKSAKSKDNLSHRTRSSDILASGTGLIDPSSSESEESERKVKPKASKELLPISGARSNLHKQSSRERSPFAQEVDPRRSAILAGLQKAGALSPRDSEKLEAPKGGLSERAGKRRPPRLDVDAVRDAEARGSLTSLPDLIKRATRLASNLDRGKTASRLGMNWFDGADADGDEKHRSGNGSGSDNRRSGNSITDMLASFPPPGLATPPGSRGGLPGENGGRSPTNWSSNLRHSHLPSDSDADEHARRRGRRCCGMPLWLFLLLLVVLVLLIAAAIIVPVVLIVVPKQNDSGSGSSTSTNACASDTSCLNGGASVMSTSGTCKCVCVNGYTGTTCATASGAGCTTAIIGSMNNATIGDAIPRLLEGAQSNFSVPLDGQTLLGLFSGADMSCQSENALVTFHSSAGSKRWVEELVVAVEPTPTILKRQTATAGDGAATSNGIIYQTGSPSTNSASATAVTASSVSTSSASPSSSGSSSDSSGNITTADFARVAVLYVLQASGQLNDAVTAQDSLQSYFKSGRTSTGQDINPVNVTLGNGYTCDLNGQRISVGNGTVVGGS